MVHGEYIKPSFERIVFETQLSGTKNARDLFIDKYSNDVITATKGTGIFPSVKMAQLLIEGANTKGEPGKGITFVKANNGFGIKADKGWKGNKIAFNTPKDNKPVNYFRSYNSIRDSIKDHTAFLQKNSRYAKNGVFTARTPEAQALALSKAGYSEYPHPRYGEGLIKIIQAYDLKRLDGMKAKSNTGKKIVIGTGILLGAGYLYNKYR